ncbi:unnamed protein product [Linum tenue]|uniref:TF-B3 domain-containing protein n=1 Tax=Linum tenue TaxID=586396 RepID=A0AAV0REY1_9ROSI|nr:unnamed protein product [Linum tenue]
MALPSRTTAGIGDGGDERRPHFFKIILDDAIRDGKLFIPTKFVKLYGGNLQDSAVLSDPSGTEWTVELTESDGDIWLQKGFREFAEFYSLSHGYLVVFELVDRWISRFNVVVFDPTATEIEYPASPPPLQLRLAEAPSSKAVPNSSPVHEGAVTSDSDESETDDDDDDSSVEILDGFPSLPGKGDRDEDLVSNCSSDVKIGTARTTAVVMCLNAGDQMKKGKFCASAPAKLEVDRNRGGAMNSGLKRLKGLSLNEKIEAIDRARAAFTSQKPHFMVAIHPSHIYPGSITAIPLSFAREHFKAKDGDAILSREYSGGRRWKLNYTVNADPGTSRIVAAAFRCGWKDFAGANQLRVGDVCAFELVKSSPDAAVHMFRVTVFRKDQKVR